MNETSKKPYFKAMIEPGKKYFWCACGKSQNQPFCDGSHSGTSFSPVMFESESQKEYTLCGCKTTKNQPFCDGSHKALQQ